MAGEIAIELLAKARFEAGEQSTAPARSSSRAPVGRRILRVDGVERGQRSLNVGDGTLDVAEAFETAESSRTRASRA
jgi:hypothetical protein